MTGANDADIFAFFHEIRGKYKIRGVAPNVSVCMSVDGVLLITMSWTIGHSRHAICEGFSKVFQSFRNEEDSIICMLKNPFEKVKKFFGE